MLRGRVLVAAVVLRELATLPLGGPLELVAPSWVIVTDRKGVVVLRVPAGREPGVGLDLFEFMRQDARARTTSAFLARWGPASRIRPLRTRLTRWLRHG